VGAAKEYLPLIHQILLTCKVQPECARLDEQLFFEWTSGIEENKRFFQSQAIMYEMVMTIATEALATAGVGCDECTSGNFAAASREFRKTAGILSFLAIHQLPQWISGSNSNHSNNILKNKLPIEATISNCEAFSLLFLAIAQQMAVATVLIKPGTPNYSLLSKLSLGIAEQIDAFLHTTNTHQQQQQQQQHHTSKEEFLYLKKRVDESFFTLLQFQSTLQKSLSAYFYARHTWDTQKQYGLAIAILNDALTYLNVQSTPTSRGIPSLLDNTSSSSPFSSKQKSSPLANLSKDITNAKHHMMLVLRTWEKDNSRVYFDKVPLTLPIEGRLPDGSGLRMMKIQPYQLMDVDPLLLILPEGAEPNTMEQELEDEELARALQDQLNCDNQAED